MNSISWLIYLASVVPSLGAWTFIFGLLGTFACVIALFAVIVNEPDLEPVWPCALRTWKWFAPVMLLGIFLSIICPDTKTMYMIAASEMGESAVQTEVAKELYGDIRDVLQSYKKESND